MNPENKSIEVGFYWVYFSGAWHVAYYEGTQWKGILSPGDKWYTATVAPHADIYLRIHPPKMESHE